MGITKLSSSLFIVFTLFCTLSKSAQIPLHSLMVEADERYYRLFTPSKYNPQTSYPLVLNFHGTNSDPYNQEVLTRFEKLGQQKQFIVVSPLALFTRNDREPITWNVDYEPGPDDVIFISHLIKHLNRTFNIDGNKIYATGFSGGARMSSRLACAIPHKIAAIAPVAGLRFPDLCKPNHGVPIISFHGEKDTINHYKLQHDSPVYWNMGIDEALGKWVKNNQCTETNIQKYSDTIVEQRYSGCDDGADILFYKSSIAGHTWPGSSQADKFLEYGLGTTEKQLDATNLIWEFFKKHHKTSLPRTLKHTSL
ncbi:alpha/beta hydrolase family esterase [Paraglaciecola marina]|uniref:alpha/beta hydrolase family esterase n=1 Tax=Paraglaciecola marina TaxID=2500157 RepID=UPI0010621E6D|nr:PHB depolymerase family esterase [Paraglaciecola marina]